MGVLAIVREREKQKLRERENKVNNGLTHPDSVAKEIKFEKVIIG